MTELLQQVIAELEKLPDEQQDAITKCQRKLTATRLLTELKNEQDWTSRFQNQTFAVHQADEIRTKLLETYGEFPDTVELIREDRAR
jgi:hypothetical protein